MNLKLMVLTGIGFLLVVFGLAFIFELPVAYVPKDATVSEYTLYHIIFMAIEVSFFSFAFMYVASSTEN